MVNKVYSFLGLAAKAGKLLSGENACERAVKSDKANLVITAGDASDNTKKKFCNICKYRAVEIRIFGKKELLGKYIGKNERSVVAVLGKEFAKHLIEIIDSLNLINGGEQIEKSKSI
jgi:ribosomal protein L7Ae-like RNA K-turn-binding protein